MRKIIYTKKLALALRKQGFKIIDVVPDENKPQFDNYIFEETPELLEAITNYTNNQRRLNNVQSEYLPPIGSHPFT